MTLKTGDYVIYRSSELCRFDGIEKKCADGVHEREYYAFTPLNSVGVKYYVPAEAADKDLGADDKRQGCRFRALHSKSEIMEIIGEMGAADEWCSDPIERKRRNAEVLAGGDYVKIAAMLRGIYLEKQRRETRGKSLNSADERVMHSAEHMINDEFSFVLGIKPEEVPKFINDHISNAV